MCAAGNIDCIQLCASTARQPGTKFIKLRDQMAMPTAFTGVCMIPTIGVGHEGIISESCCAEEVEDVPKVDDANDDEASASTVQAEVAPVKRRPAVKTKKKDAGSASAKADVASAPAVISRGAGKRAVKVPQRLTDDYGRQHDVKDQPPVPEQDSPSPRPHPATRAVQRKALNPWRRRPSVAEHQVCALLLRLLHLACAHG